ncbi:MAG: hypothetical protein K6E40_12730 [Desulfovibrio sp.]|nr:hypothetical protein [Desulfovibrio sp.]
MKCLLPATLAAAVLAAALPTSARATSRPDIVAATMRGGPADIDRALSQPENSFRLKTYGEHSFDARDMALYMALVCGRTDNARHMLKRGAGEGGYAPEHPLERIWLEPQDCRKPWTAESVRRNIYERQKAEGDDWYEGDCSTGDSPLFDFPAEALDAILEHDRSLCQTKSGCGWTLLEKLVECSESSNDPARCRRALAVWKKRCR